jgi:hypothetical protein
MTENTYRCYSLYDSKGRRLSIFGQPTYASGEFDSSLPTKPTHILITIFTCSKKDTFVKKKAIELYEDYKAGNILQSKPIIFYIPVVDEKPGKSFINFLNDTYFRKFVEIVVARQDVLVNNTGEIVLKTGKPKLEWITV